MSSSITDADLIARAGSILRPRRLSPTVEAADVGSALVTKTGMVHIGVSIDAACGIGFCAEHAAIASMVTHGESRIRTIVAVDDHGKILAPCGRCRELIYQIDPGNVETRIIMPGGKIATLHHLLPEHWRMNRRVRTPEIEP